MKTLLALSLILITFSFPAIAEDRKIVGAGDSIRTKNFVTETPFEYVDFYKRRFAYKESRDELRANIEERRRHYNAARSTVVENHKNDSHARHGRN